MYQSRKTVFVNLRLTCTHGPFVVGFAVELAVFDVARSVERL